MGSVRGKPGAGDLGARRVMTAFPSPMDGVRPGPDNPMESHRMSGGFRPTLGRAVCLLTALGLLAATVPGCGGEPPKPPEQVQKEDNSAMLNFMKSQQQKKK